MVMCIFAGIYPGVVLCLKVPRHIFTLSTRSGNKTLTVILNDRGGWRETYMCYKMCLK